MRKSLIDILNRLKNLDFEEIIDCNHDFDTKELEILKKY
jgi:hypothetical protein